MSEYIAELAGTAVLVFIGFSAIMLNFGEGSPIIKIIPHVGVRLLLTAAIFAGVGSLVAISPFGQRSGAHINPSVSLGFWILGRMHRHDLFAYILAQVLGAVLGTIAFYAVWGDWAESIQFGATLLGEGVTILQGFVAEAGITFLLMLTILLCLSSDKTARWTPLVVWVLIVGVVYAESPVTGTSFNPARSFGPALIGGMWRHHWLYWVAPPIGAVLAVLVFHLGAMGRRRVRCCKLFHPLHSRNCIFKDCAYLDLQRQTDGNKQ